VRGRTAGTPRCSADSTSLVLAERKRYTRGYADDAALAALAVSAPDDYYSLLRVAPGASFAEVKAAYRALAKLVHPDVVGEAAHDLAIVLNLANATLTDETTRVAYDQALREWRSVAGSFDGQPVSEWRGTDADEDAVFIDECACIGCGKCVHVAPATFGLEEDWGACAGRWTRHLLPVHCCSALTLSASQGARACTPSGVTRASSLRRPSRRARSRRSSMSSGVSWHFLNSL
jgi:curved DNA-binding protein CbpA